MTRPDFTVAPAGVPDWIADPQPGFGYKMQTGFGMMRGFSSDEVPKGQRRRWWPSKAARLTKFDQTIHEAIRFRKHRFRLDFATGAPRVSLAAFRPEALARGARPHVPGDPVPPDAVRFAVTGCAVMGEFDFVWDHGLWVGTYRTWLDPACQAARDAVMRWWQAQAGRHEQVYGRDPADPLERMVGRTLRIPEARADVFHSAIGR